MNSSSASLPLLLLLILVLLINSSTADSEVQTSSSTTTSSDTEKLHIDSLDKSWRLRAKAALAEAEKAYHPDPLEVVNHLNKHVHKTADEVEVVATNRTRRELRGKRKRLGKCTATNPIDRCWRCRPNWASERKRIADCVLGFGRNTIGGVNGEFYVVTDASDDDLVNPRPGTLRHAVTRREPLWIIFSRSMIIRLSEELIVSSFKTIDGRGHQIRIANGAQITLQFVHHIIITNIHVHDIHAGKGGFIRDKIDHYGKRDKSDGDGISIYGSSNIWIDHVSMSNCVDGLIDAIFYSTAITISNSHFTRHLEVLLFGAHNGDAGDRIMQVTVAFNHFGRGLDQRMPRGRFGFFHIVNNDYTHWEMYAIGGSQDPTFISQGNRFNAPRVTNPKHNATEVTKREYTPESEWKSWLWKSEGDLLLNHAFFVESGDLNMVLPYSTREMIEPKPGEFAASLTLYAGTLDCFEGKPC